MWNIKIEANWLHSHWKLRLETCQIVTDNNNNNNNKSFITIIFQCFISCSLWHHKSLTKTYSTMIVRVKSRERIFKRVVTLSFPPSPRMYENKSSQSYRCDFQLKECRKIITFSRCQPMNGGFRLLIELSQWKF